MGVICLNPQTIPSKIDVPADNQTTSSSSPIHIKPKYTKTVHKCKPLPSFFKAETVTSKKDEYKINCPNSSIASKPSFNSFKFLLSPLSQSKLSIQAKSTSRSLNIDSICTLTEENIEHLHNDIDDLFDKESVNVLIMSAPGCGTTSLGYRIAEGKFSKAYIPSIGIEIKHRLCKVNEKIKNMNIVMLPSDNNIKGNYTNLFSLCSLCFIVYDVMNEESFIKAKEIYENEIKNRKGIISKVVFIGNKIDLISKDNENDIINEVNVYCNKQNICNYLVSAKTAKGIRVLMESVLKKLT